MSSAQSEASVARRQPPAIGWVIGAFAIDAALVVVFAATGRASHGEDALVGLWRTAWPFLAGLVIGWVATFGWRAPLAPVRTGLGVWAATLVGGMLLRALSGQGTAIPFVVVATVVLLVFLVGWRVIARLVSRLVARRRGSSGDARRERPAVT